MTKQLFSDLNDLAAEQVLGGAQGTFFTPQVIWNSTVEAGGNGDAFIDAEELEWTGYFKQHQANANGSLNMTGGVSNNTYTAIQANVTSGSKGDVRSSGLSSVTYWYDDDNDPATPEVSTVLTK